MLGNTVQQHFAGQGRGREHQIPLRNRMAQADQARSQMEYRQSQMRLQQLYTQIRIQVINGAVCVDQRPRAGAGGAGGARLCGAGAGRGAEEVQAGRVDDGERCCSMERNLATAADNNLISATAAYARDRAALGQIAVEHAGQVRHQHHRRRRPGRFRRRR